MSESASSTARGVVYIVWGDKADRFVDRSVNSLRVHHPQMPVHVERVAPPDPSRGLAEKCKMAHISPFKNTLYLDADTVVMGNLDFGFEQAERFGLACVICECPWMRRYGQPGEEHLTEYNTGVLFFTDLAPPVFSTWQKLAPTTPSASRWTAMDNVPRGLSYDDQAGFARAIRQCNFNPFVLPINYNFRPHFFKSAFAPIKVWHDYIDPPAGLAELSIACERGLRPVTLFDMSVAPPRP